MREIIFEISEPPVEGLTISAFGYGIHTQGDTPEELPDNIREAVDCYFNQDIQVLEIGKLK